VDGERAGRYEAETARDGGECCPGEAAGGKADAEEAAGRDGETDGGSRTVDYRRFESYHKSVGFSRAASFVGDGRYPSRALRGRGRTSRRARFGLPHVFLELRDPVSDREHLLHLRRGEPGSRCRALSRPRGRRGRRRRRRRVPPASSHAPRRLRYQLSLSRRNRRREETRQARRRAPLPVPRGRPPRAIASPPPSSGAAAPLAAVAPTAASAANA
jgi:hypothetical protein